MADPHPPRGPHATAQPAAQPVRAEVQRVDGTQYRPIVRYYKQMRVQRTYRLRVALPRVADARPPVRLSGGPVRIRPVIAGAVVNPAEANLDPGKPDVWATFQVTPAAVGRLRDARVELYHQDRLVTELPLKMKGTRQTLTWVLLCLTILVPLLFVPVFGQDDWTRSSGQVKDRLKHPSLFVRPGSARPAGQGQAAAADNKPGAKDQGGAQSAPKPAANTDSATNRGGNATRPGAGRDQARGGQGDQGRGGRGGRGGPAHGPQRGGGGRLTPPALPATPFEQVNPGGNATETPAAPEVAKANKEQQLHGTVEREVFHVLPVWIPEKVSEPVATRLQYGYDFVAAYAINWPEMPFYLAAGLLVLTIGSWVFHAGYRGRRRGKPILLAP